MDRLIIQDDLKAESRKWGWISLVFFVFAGWFVYSGITSGWETVYMIGVVAAVFSGSCALIRFLRDHQYCLMVSDRELTVKTLSKRTVIKFEDINSFVCGQIKKSHLYGFRIFYQDKQINIVTRFPDVIVKVFNKHLKFPIIQPTEDDRMQSSEEADAAPTDPEDREKGEQQCMQECARQAEQECVQEIAPLAEGDEFVEFPQEQAIIRRETATHIKVIRAIAPIILILSVVSFPIAFSLMDRLSEPEIFDLVGTVRYSYILYFFIPVPMVSIILALYLRVKKEPYLLNLILGLVVLPPMLLFGSFQFFMGEDYSDAAVISVAETVDFSLPQDLKTATSYLYGCGVTQAKIESEEEKASFLASVQESELWAETLKSKSLKMH